MEYLKIWTSFRQDISALSDAEKGRLFDAMLKYAEDCVAPQLGGGERIMWPLAERYIDSTRKDAKKQKENGSRGGRPRNPEEPTETQQNPTEPTETYKSKYKTLRDDEEECTTTRGPCAAAFKRQFGRFPYPGEESSIMFAAKRNKQTDDLMELAIQLSAEHGAASPAMYVEKMLNEWSLAGIKTLDDFYNREEA